MLNPPCKAKIKYKKVKVESTIPVYQNVKGLYVCRANYLFLKDHPGRRAHTAPAAVFLQLPNF